MISVNICRLEASDWDNILGRFEDASIYQTHAYAANRWGNHSIEHLVLREADKVVAAAQVVMVRIPLLGGGIAYVPWGPLWRVKNGNINVERFKQITDALKAEYSLSRGMLVRIAPAEVESESISLVPPLLSSGWRLSNWKAPHKTILVDLRPPLEEIRKGMSPKWRENLRRGERGKFTLVEETSTDILNRFSRIFLQMWQLKQFTQHVDYHQFVQIQGKLPSDFKLNTLLCTLDEQDVAGIVWTQIGRMGIPLFSASVGEGRKQRAAYLMRWKALERMKENGCQFLDQGGVSQSTNPGSYAFKEGMGGQVVSFLGYFDACDSAWSRSVIGLAEKSRSLLDRCRNTLHKMNKSTKINSPSNE